MRTVRWFTLLGILLTSLLVPQAPGEADLDPSLESRTLNFATKAFQERAIHDPETIPATRSPVARSVYRKTVDTVVLVFTKEGALGSGVIFHPDGWLVTNWHVVADAPRVGVVFRNERLLSGQQIAREDVFIADVIHRDPTRDLALLRLQRKPSHLAYAAFADLKQLEVGEEVFAIGHPKGYFWTYTQGIVSQIRPNYHWRTPGGEHRATVIQTQTTVAQGSSGGPLFDSTGKLAGIIAAGNPEAPGLNFAVATNELNAFIQETHGAARR